MKPSLTRREFVKISGATAALGLTGGNIVTAASGEDTTPPARGPFEATWESLSQNYQCPAWFRDAKFGIWAHWSAQCVPEQGDWYARKMYLQGDPSYEYHVKTYGHPSKFGFMEIDNLWKAERWEPDKLMALYKRAGAKYFLSLANHHDNFDAYDSTHHAWNSVNVGAKKDIVGLWAKAARAHGLRFGVSNHSSHAWRWMQPAYGYDGEGPLAGVRYDAATLTKADGKGKWWEGLDPQELYIGRNLVIPDGIVGARAVRDWNQKNNSPGADPDPAHPFVRNWYLRCKDLVDKYRPDLLYFDTNELPLGQAGLDVVSHYYNASAARNHGKVDVVVNGKHIKPAHAGAFIEDIERGVAGGLRPDPWQIDTCIGQWHYSRAIAEQKRYKTVGQVVCMLADVVSKNGNLMLSIPMRGDGTIDEQEVAFLEGMATWMKVNGEGIYGSRPWKIFGEGPTRMEGREQTARPYTPEDVRFTTKNKTLYAFVMAWPESRQAVIKSLALGSEQMADAKVSDVSLLGHRGKLNWTQNEQGLSVLFPEKPPCEHVVTLKIQGVPT